MSTKPHFADQLEKLNACSEAVAWARTQPSAKAAWRNCQRGDWMLWLLGKLDRSEPYSAERRPLVAATCACARLAWKWMPTKSRAALVLFEKWSRGKNIAIEELKQARAYAYAAYATATTAATAAAAYAAATAATAATTAATDAATAATAAADAATMTIPKTLAQCADIVRQYRPQPPTLRMK